MNELPPAIRVLVLFLLDLPGRAFWFIGLAYSINIAIRLSTDPVPVTPDSLWTIAYLLALWTVGLLMVMFAAVLWRRRSDTLLAVLLHFHPSWKEKWKPVTEEEQLLDENRPDSAGAIVPADEATP